MANYNFSALIGTTLTGFNPLLDTIGFSGTYHAAQLSLSQSGSSTLVSYGSQNLNLANFTASSLSGNQLVFADGSFWRQGSSAADTLAGSGFNDRFDISSGGSDNITAGAGDDVIVAGANLDAGDVINGGLGTADELRIAGNYASRVDFGTNTVTGIERFVFGTGGSVWRGWL